MKKYVEICVKLFKTCENVLELSCQTAPLFLKHFFFQFNTYSGGIEDLSEDVSIRNIRRYQLN